MSHDNLKNSRQFELKELLLNQKFLWLIAWLLGIATVLSVLGLVMLSGWFITMAGVAGVIAVGSHALNYLMPSALIRTFAITRTLARYGDLMVSHHAVFKLLKDLRVKFFSRWAKLPSALRMGKQGSSSQTMQRLVKDIDVLDEFVLRLVSPLLVSSVAVILLSIMMLTFMPTSWLSVVFLALSLFIAVMTLWRGVVLARRESQLMTLRKSKLLDTLPALTSLLTWGRWHDVVRELSHHDNRHHQLTIEVMNKKRNAQAMIQISIALSIVALLYLAGRAFEQGVSSFTLENLNSHHALNPAIMLALTLGVFGMMEIVSMLVAEPLALGRSVVAKERINEMVGAHTPAKKRPITTNTDIILKNLSVKMPSAIIGAAGINAVLTCDKPTLIIGASGTGKSTLLATLAGEVPRMSGEILLGDAHGADIDEFDFGQSLGFLGQNVDIFDQTLADNLRLGKPSASDDELWAMLDKVNLTSWARQQPKGLDTPLGEYGMAISGGQGRRVALARLLLSPKQVLLLDEPFAGLDSATRQIVWNALTDMQKSGDIGVLAIATHQIWDEMSDVHVLKIG